MVKVSVKPVLKLIRYHASGDFEAAKEAAFEIAKELENVNDGQLSEYIFVQYNPSAGWVPMSSPRKTSAEWYEEERHLYKIMDPDGWNRKNYQYSFYEEKITKEEYDKRVLMSTLMASKEYYGIK